MDECSSSIKSRTGGFVPFYALTGQFGLDAIDLRWKLKDIIAKRWMLTPLNPVHIARLIELGLVEMTDDQPVVTLAGQQVIWIPD